MKNLKDWCIENKREDILNAWNELGNGLDIDEVSYGSQYKAKFICPNGHEYKQTVYFVTHRGYGCPVCGKKVSYYLLKGYKKYVYGFIGKSKLF